MLSFDITDRVIRIIKGQETNGKIRIAAAASLDLDEEVIVNGHVRDVPRLATLINQVLRTNKMVDKEAIVSISSNMTIFKELHIQKAAKEQDFMKMVRAEMQAALGIDESYSVSYIIVGDSDQTEGALKILATACPYEVVDCYKRVFNMLQVSLRSVMIGCNCITKVLLADTKVKSKMPLLAVQIDNNFISLNLYEKGQLSFSRFASISAEDYDDSSDYVFEAVNENVFRMLQFQKSKSDSDPIENVVFYGDTREYVRLTNELEKMGIRTSIINVPPQIHGYEHLEFSSYANAIGAMFKRNKETERINLLETDTVNNNKIKSDRGYAAILLLAVLASIALCFVGWLFYVIRNAAITSQIKDIEEKQKSTYAQQLTEQNQKLTELNKSVSSYYQGVKSAVGAYNSRPYPSSADYTLIADTVFEAIKETYKDENITEDNKDDFFFIDSLNYNDGVYTMSVRCKAQEDMPFQELPSNLYQKFNDLEKVNYVAYPGYTAPSNGKINPELKDENAEKVDFMTMSLSISMKGDAVDVNALKEAK